MAEKPARTTGQNGRLSIPLPFEDAIKAALEVKPPPKQPKKRSGPKKAKPKS